MSVSPPPDDAEQRMREIQKKIDDVLELLALQTDREAVQEELQNSQERHSRTRGSQELAFVKGSKHKNLCITQHSHANLELVQALKKMQKFEEYPRNLLKHLDTLTDKLLAVVQELPAKKRKCK